jgi:hypothetical protein
MAVRPAIFDCHVPALDIAGFARADEAPSLTATARDGDGNVRSGWKNARGAGRTKEWSNNARQKWRDAPLTKKAPYKPNVAVCLLPGTEIVFDENVEREPSFGIGLLPNEKIGQRLYGGALPRSAGACAVPSHGCSSRQCGLGSRCSLVAFLAAVASPTRSVTPFPAGRHSVISWTTPVSSSTTIPSNAQFAGSDGGAERWATVCSLIASAKFNDVERFTYLRDILQRMTEDHPMSRLNDLLPWNWPKVRVKH